MRTQRPWRPSRRSYPFPPTWHSTPTDFPFLGCRHTRPRVRACRARGPWAYADRLCSGGGTAPARQDGRGARGAHTKPATLPAPPAVVTMPAGATVPRHPAARVQYDAQSATSAGAVEKYRACVQRARARALAPPPPLRATAGGTTSADVRELVCVRPRLLATHREGRGDSERSPCPPAGPRTLRGPAPRRAPARQRAPAGCAAWQPPAHRPGGEPRPPSERKQVRRVRAGVRRVRRRRQSAYTDACSGCSAGASTRAHARARRTCCCLRSFCHRLISSLAASMRRKATPALTILNRSTTKTTPTNWHYASPPISSTSKGGRRRATRRGGFEPRRWQQKAHRCMV